MKSANEIRALMDKDNSMIPKIMAILEKTIVKAAKSGYRFKDVFISVSECSLVCANNIRSQLLDLGYDCRIDYIVDHRDGDCIEFYIKW